VQIDAEDDNVIVATGKLVDDLARDRVALGARRSPVSIFDG
jgi:hypothetical protein